MEDLLSLEFCNHKHSGISKLIDFCEIFGIYTIKHKNIGIQVEKRRIRLAIEPMCFRKSLDWTAALGFPDFLGGWMRLIFPKNFREPKQWDKLYFEIDEKLVL